MLKTWMYKNLLKLILFILLVAYFGNATAFSQSGPVSKLCILPELSFKPDTNKNKKSTFSATSNVHRFAFSVGMGISLLNNSSFTNYLRREIPYSSTDSIKSFTTGIEFFGGIEYVLSKNFSMKLDYSYAVRSATYSSPNFITDYNYDINMHQGYLMAYYLIPKPSFDLKFGIGAGYLLTLLSTQATITSSNSYKASGFSFRGEGVFAPYLSKNFQAVISGFVTVNNIGSFKNTAGNYLTSSNSTEQVNFSGFGAGVRIGFSYIFK
jgi:hypothetical protein